MKAWIRPLLPLALVVSALQYVTPTHSAPRQPASSTLTVNTSSDFILPDRYLSLREALGAANSSLTIDYSEEEQLLMSGCIFDDNGNGTGDIIGGCGAGIVDSIVFAASLGNSPIITLWLNSPLPPIDDTAATIIEGQVNNVYPIINAAKTGLNTDGLTITSNDNAIYGLTVISATRDGFRITGSNNTVGMGSSARANARHGIVIDGGDNNLIQDSSIGAYTSAPYVCAGNGATGITLRNGAANNTLRNVVVGCNPTGISIINSGSDSNQIGPNARIGIAPDGTALPNTNYGVRISDGAKQNLVITSTVSNNSTGVAIQGSGSVTNTVRASVIRHNSASGIEVSNGARFSAIGGSLGSGFAQGNLISANTTGIIISDATTAFTYVYGNRIGTNAAGTAADGNTAAGIHIVWANTNFIGNGPTERNLISGNGYGLWIKMAIINQVQGNFIGGNMAGDAAIPNGVGVYLSDGSQSNLIGGADSSNANVIAWNTSNGVLISGSATTSNTLAGNHIASNSASGVRVASGAQYNSIENGRIYSNTQHGVEFHGANTSLNVITRTEIYQNGVNGIAEGGGAANNVWREMSIYSNGGLGINQGSEYPLTERPDPPANFRITAVNQTTGDVSGEAISSSNQIHTLVDLYRLALDPSGYGEGRYFIGSAETDADGVWTINDPTFNGGCYTAVVRSIANGVTLASEFAYTNCGLFLPLVVR